jgi:hypothetical protein
MTKQLPGFEKGPESVRPGDAQSLPCIYQLRLPRLLYSGQLELRLATISCQFRPEATN